MIKFPKSPPGLIATFADVIPPSAEKKMMFGYPAAFANGNMFMSLFGTALILRLPEDARADLIADGGAMFEPMKGRPMREYVAVPDAMLNDVSRLKPWVQRSLDFAQSLPPKAKKKSTKRSPARRPR
jgi:TfoX/Sxy family transcriptional regulator of competence genes